jgi:hypothetical protein
VILGGCDAPREEPRWVCLGCNAGWLDVHNLAMQEREYQEKLEAAVIQGEFQLAAQWRDRRRELARKRLGLLKVLQNESY